MTAKPKLVIPEPNEKPVRNLGSVSWEKRRKMTAAQLIELMGPLWVNHPDYKPRPRSLLPMPNLAGRQPVISSANTSMWHAVAGLVAWVVR